MQGGRRYLKLIGFWASFLILHYAYGFFPVLPIKLVSGVDESFFQHAKVAFFAYGLVSLIEWAVWRKRVRNLESFMGKSQKTPPLATEMNGKAGDFGTAALKGFSLRKLPEGETSRKPRRFAPGSFIFSRLFVTTVLPWFVFIAWFSAAAYYGRMPNVVAEIVFANVALILAGACALFVEQAMEGVTYSRVFKVVVAALFVVSLSLYIIFTFKLPWADVFAEPGG